MFLFSTGQISCIRKLIWCKIIVVIILCKNTYTFIKEIFHYIYTEYITLKFTSRLLLLKKSNSFSSTIDLPLCMKWSFFWFNLLFFLACSNTYEPRLKFVKFSTWWHTFAVKVNQVTHTKRYGFLLASSAAVVIDFGLEAASANTFASIPQQRRFILIVLSLTIIFSCNKR